MKKDFRRWYSDFVEGKTRVVGAWLALFFLYVAVGPAIYWPGVVLMFAGALLRFVASGYIDKEGRLSIAGPYAYSRNPLYLGSFFLTLGSALTVGSWWLALLYLAIFFAIYHFIILNEEVRLGEKFAGIFPLYCQKVPRYLSLVPRRADLRQELKHERVNSPRFDLALIKENKGYEGIFTFLGLLAFILIVRAIKY